MGEVLGRFLQATLGQQGLGPRADQGHGKVTEARVKRIEISSGMDRQDWKFKFEMAVKVIRGGSVDFHISSQISFILVQKLGCKAFDLVKNVLEKNGFEAWRRLRSRFGAVALGARGFT